MMWIYLKLEKWYIDTIDTIDTMDTMDTIDNIVNEQQDSYYFLFYSILHYILITILYHHCAMLYSKCPSSPLISSNGTQKLDLFFQNCLILHCY
jgi:hypothetical protein